MRKLANATPHPLLRATPNSLSTLRILLAGLLPLLEEAWWLPCVVVAGLTDWLDGMLARRLGITSWMGGILDGIADKLFVFSALMTLWTHGVIPGWWVPLLLARDFIVALGTLIALIRRNRRALRNLGSRLFGKAATILMFVLLVTVLGADGIGTVQQVSFLLAALLSVAAAIDYSRVRVRDLIATGGRVID